MTRIMLATAMFGALLLGGCVYEPYPGYGYGERGYGSHHEARGNWAHGYGESYRGGHQDYADGDYRSRQR